MHSLSLNAKRARFAERRSASHPAHRLERSFSADSAARSGIEVSIQPLQIHEQSATQSNSHAVCRLRRDLDLCNVGALIEQSLPEQKARRQFSVIARRPHRHGYRADRSQAIAFLRDLNLERVFYSNVIADTVRPLAVYPANPDESGMGENWHAWFVNNTL